MLFFKYVEPDRLTLLDFTLPCDIFTINHPNKNPLLLKIDTMQNLDNLAIFVRISEMGSFTHAAESLGIQKGRASNVVRQLENQVGTRLLHRSTRKVQLTEDGRNFYIRACALLNDAEELSLMFTKDNAPLDGRVRVDLPTEFARANIIPTLPEFMAKYPGIELEISSTDRRVDLVQEGMDCVLRVGEVLDDSLVARHLGSLKMVNAASPEYLEKYGIPHTLEDLTTQGHRIVHYTPTLGGRPFGWEYYDGESYKTLNLPGSLRVNNVQTYHGAGLAGLGLIQAGLSSLTPFLSDGSLVEVLPTLQPEPLPVYIVVAHRQNLSRRVRVFIAWLESVLKPYLD